MPCGFQRRDEHGPDVNVHMTTGGDERDVFEDADREDAGVIDMRDESPDVLDDPCRCRVNGVDIIAVCLSGGHMHAGGARNSIRFLASDNVRSNTVHLILIWASMQDTKRVENAVMNPTQARNGPNCDECTETWAYYCILTSLPPLVWPWRYSLAVCTLLPFR